MSYLTNQLRAAAFVATDNATVTPPAPAAGDTLAAAVAAAAIYTPEIAANDDVNTEG